MTHKYTYLIIGGGTEMTGTLRAPEAPNGISED